MKKIVLIILSLLSFSLVAATDPMAAYKLAKAGKAVLVDVREADELKSGMIEGAVWFPISKVETQKDWKDEFVSQSKGKTIFLYCRSGNRSGKFQKLLKEHDIDSENIGGFITLKEILPVKIP